MLILGRWERSHQGVATEYSWGELSVLRGFPPNVIWIRRGNCSTQEIENLLRRREDAVKQLRGDEKTGVIELY